MAEEEATQLYKRRAAELKRLDLCGRRPFPKVGRPTLESLCDNALILQVRTDPDSTKHITDKTVPQLSLMFKRYLLVLDLQSSRNMSRNTSLQLQSLLRRNSGHVWPDISFNGC